MNISKILERLSLSVTAIALLVVSAPLAHAGNNGRSDDRQGGPVGAFHVSCDFSHQAAVDPIVHPGMTEMSHVHHFFGNTSTDAFSTGQSLLAGATTCNDPENLSSYWVPALLQDGATIQPLRASIRYQVGPQTRAFPLGFMALTGRTNQSARWGCRFPGDRAEFTSSIDIVPVCSDGAHLVSEVNFGQCWDGFSLDSSDHASHLVAPSRQFDRAGQCPESHPVSVPRVSLQTIYPLEVRGGQSISLSSGGPETMHADIFEAWRGDSLAQQIAEYRESQSRLINREDSGQPQGRGFDARPPRLENEIGRTNPPRGNLGGRGRGDGPQATPGGRGRGDGPQATPGGRGRGDGPQATPGGRGR